MSLCWVCLLHSGQTRSPVIHLGSNDIPPTDPLALLVDPSRQSKKTETA